MALDKEFFDSVNIDVVKKKYYNANKVNALLGNIQQQAETMGQENELLRTQLEALNGQKSEIGDTLLSARASSCVRSSSFSCPIVSACCWMLPSRALTLFAL